MDHTQRDRDRGADGVGADEERQGRQAWKMTKRLIVV